MSANEPALTLYMHPLAAYCWKVLIALDENQTPFRHELVQGDPKTQEVLSRLGLIGKMPLLRDAARDTAVSETSIIVDYLERHYPGPASLIPADPEAAREVRLWDRFFDLYVSTPMQKIVGDRLRPEGKRDPFGVQEARSQLETAYTVAERRMTGLTWAAGDHFTLADCSAFPALFYADAVQPFRASRPALARYFERLLERPSVRQTVRAAQPYFPLFPYKDALDPRFTSSDF